MTFTLTSSSFRDGDTLPDAHVHARGNVSPPLAWSGAPAGTKSFAVTCFDPDAPTGSGFWHWTVANIPVDVTELAAGAGAVGGAKLPKGAVQGRTDYGEAGFGGAAPPPGHGPHRYIFTVFAVDTDHLKVGPDDSGAVFGFNLHFHTLAKASITATYENRDGGRSGALTSPSIAAKRPRHERCRHRLPGFQLRPRLQGRHRTIDR
jgi:hypothetical protein